MKGHGPHSYLESTMNRRSQLEALTICLSLIDTFPVLRPVAPETPRKRIVSRKRKAHPAKPRYNPCSSTASPARIFGDPWSPDRCAGIRVFADHNKGSIAYCCLVAASTHRIPDRCSIACFIRIRPCVDFRRPILTFELGAWDGCAACR